LGSYEEFQTKLEEFVSAHLPSNPTTCRSKVIHEALWGTNLFLGHEVSLLDTPLLQRLRGVHQTALAYLTFPTSLHSRFDHSLGVLVQANNLAVAVQKNEPLENCDLSDQDIQNLRFASLIHDIGHCLFSHTSEEVYTLLPIIDEIKAHNPAFSGGKAHEILSCLLVNEYFSLLEPLIR